LSLTLLLEILPIPLPAIVFVPSLALKLLLLPTIVPLIAG
jgi:hypothetical protein